MGDNTNKVLDLNYPLNNNWQFYIHLHNNKSWTYDSYIHLMNIKYMEEALTILDDIHFNFIKKTLIFFMKDNIKPLWEDEENRNGGCFSFKIPNKDIEIVWKHMFYCIIGNTLCDENYMKDVNGFSISPKKNFCIMKIWMKTKKYMDPTIFRTVPKLPVKNCLFKNHEF